MTAAIAESEQDSLELDPVFLHARKGAVVIFGLWLIVFVWAVPFCYWNGYIDKFDPDNLNTIGGIPSWLFWGIVIPWILADLFTAWFCFCNVKDDDLGTAHEGADLEEEIAQMHEAAERDARA